MRAAEVAVGLVAAAALLTGCGGRDGGGGDALSKAEYIERGDEICKSIEEDSQQYAVPPPDAPLSAHEQFMSDVLDLVYDARDEFQALDAPDGDEDAKERFDSYWDRVVSYIERARDAAAAEDRQEYDDLTAELEGDTELGEAFRDYGFEVCGNT